MVERPWGIGMISILGMIGSIISVLAGIFGAMLLGILLGPFGALLGTLLGVVLVIVGAVDFVIFYGLWRMKRWAWIAETILLTLGILVGITTTIITRGLGNVLSIIIGAIILYYLYSKRTLFSSKMPMQKEEYIYQKSQETLTAPMKLYKKLAILSIGLIIFIVLMLLTLSYLGGSPQPLTSSSSSTHLGKLTATAQVYGNTGIGGGGMLPSGLRVSLANNENGPITLISVNSTVNGVNVGWSFVTQGINNTSGYLTLGTTPAGTGMLEEAALTSGKWTEPSSYPIDFEIHYTYNGQNLISFGEITGQAQ